MHKKIFADLNPILQYKSADKISNLSNSNLHEIFYMSEINLLHYLKKIAYLMQGDYIKYSLNLCVIFHFKNELFELQI